MVRLHQAEHILTLSAQVNFNIPPGQQKPPERLSFLVLRLVVIAHRGALPREVFQNQTLPTIKENGKVLTADTVALFPRHDVARLRIATEDKPLFDVSGRP